MRPIYIGLACAGTALGMVLAAGLLLVTQRRQVVAFDCGASANPELILQSGPEYILANPSITETTNSSLVSLELRDPAGLPARWRFQDASVVRSDGQGLELRANGEGGGSLHEFSSASGDWRSRYGSAQPEVVRCKRLPALPASIQRLNGVPLEYLSLRPWPLPILNPDVREPGLRLTLARILSGRSGSDYSFFKLLSPLSRTSLTPADEERLQASRQALLSELSATESFWEYSGNSSAGWDYANEQGEAQRHAADWCRQRSEGTLASRLADGWQVSASSPQSIESGKQRALYPDGRFAGYVDYSASCQGTQYTLRKDGDLSRLP